MLIQVQSYHCKCIINALNIGWLLAEKLQFINGEDVMTLSKGDSTYIPIRTKHCLENKTSDPLQIIEVQSGTYLGEDDIVRFEDIYKRKEY